jgi:hypothetical protein
MMPLPLTLTKKIGACHKNSLSAALDAPNPRALVASMGPVPDARAVLSTSLSAMKIPTDRQRAYGFQTVSDDKFIDDGKEKEGVR